MIISIEVIKLKSEDKTTYPGRIDTQPYTMERTSQHITTLGEEIAKHEGESVETENDEKDYAVESNDEYAGL